MNASATIDSKGDDGCTKLPSIRIPPPAPCSSITPEPITALDAFRTSFTLYGNGALFVFPGIRDNKVPSVVNGPVIDEQF